MFKILYNYSTDTYRDLDNITYILYTYNRNIMFFKNQLGIQYDTNSLHIITFIGPLDIKYVKF